MKKYGFASAGMIYTLLVLFLILTVTMLNSMQNKKTVLDNLKADTVTSLYCNEDTIADLRDKITELTKEITTLKSSGNASAKEILSGKTASVKGNLITGTMTNYGREPNTNSLTTYNNHLYLYVPNYKTGINGSVGEEAGLIQRGIHTSLSNLGNASTSQVLSGATFTSTSGLKVTGTMVDRGTNQYTGGLGCFPNGCGSGDSQYYALNNIPEGYYHKDGYSWAPEIRVNANQFRSALGISADKIVKGQSIAGVTGTGTTSQFTYLTTIGYSSSWSSTKTWTASEKSIVMVVAYCNVTVSINDVAQSRSGTWAHQNAGGIWYLTVNAGSTLKLSGSGSGGQGAIAYRIG